MQATMKSAASRFSIFLTVAMLAGGNACAEDHEGFIFTYEGENCLSAIKNDVFDGKIAWVSCISNTPGRIPITGPMRVEVRCVNNAAKLGIWIVEYVLKDALRLRTALDGVETPEWNWEIEPIENRTLFISPAIPTIKALLEHSRLQIRIIESNGKQHDDDIDISRLGEAIAPVREICGL